MEAKSTRGFTLIELLVVVVIIGIIATVAVPALITALDRGRQKRTMADLHTIGVGIQAYVVDTSLYPVGSDIAVLDPLLSGDYIRRLPRTDGWSRPFIYTGVAGLGYTIGSAGKDGGLSLALVGNGGATSSLNDDIIFSNGEFVQWPHGAQVE